MPAVTTLGMNPRMAALAKCNEVAPVVGSTLRQRSPVMHFLRSYQNSLFITQFTERMTLHITVTDTFPSPSIPTAYSRISVILLVAFILFFRMLLTEPSFGQLRTTWVRTWPLRSSWHHFTFLPIEKAFEGFLPQRLASFYSFASITISYSITGILWILL